MHFAQRAYVLVGLTAVLAVAGIWSVDPALAGLWRLPLGLLLAGLAAESLLARRTVLGVRVDAPRRVYLGRPEPAALVFESAAPVPLRVEYAPAVPAALAALGGPREVRVEPGGGAREPVTLVPIALGRHAWPALPARVLGRFGLAWWSRDLDPAHEVSVAPDTVRAPVTRPRGTSPGLRPRRAAGGGSELHQLRSYVPGDPLGSIDWKATARSGRLVAREFSEDQHLDIVLAVDAGRLSRVRAGELDRLGVYANLAARFAEGAVPSDDRVGLVVYADRPLVVCAPGRGAEAVVRIRRALEGLAADVAESDPVAAAVRIRALLRHRSLVVMLTDLADAAHADPLLRAVRILSPPHLVVVAGVVGTEGAALARREATDWRDPWIALAALEQESRARAQLRVLDRLGVPVVAAPADRLERAVFAEYESLRRRHRI